MDHPVLIENFQLCGETRGGLQAHSRLQGWRQLTVNKRQPVNKRQRQLPLKQKAKTNAVLHGWTRKSSTIVKKQTKKNPTMTESFHETDIFLEIYGESIL